MPTWTRKLLWENLPRDGTWELPPRITIRICVDCNARMGKLYEDTTAPLLKPMITGLDIIGLSPRNQTLVGRWCIKTALLFHMKQAMELDQFHQEDADVLHRMNQGGPAPDTSSVRIAKFMSQGTDEKPGEPYRGSLVGAQPLTSIGYSQIGHLAIEVISGHREPLLDFIRRTEDDKRFVRMWPPSVKSVDFAPEGFLTQSDFNVMRRQLAILSGTTHTFSRSGAPKQTAKHP